MKNAVSSVRDCLMRTCLLGRSTLKVLCLSILVITGILGCTQAVEEERETIRFVTWKPNIPEAWKEIFQLFEAEYPDINVVREVGPHSSTAFHDLLAQKLKNRSEDVDVFLMDVIWPPEFGAAGWAMPLDEMFSPLEQEAFLRGPVLANTYKGKIYGVPLFIDSGILYYRKDLLEKYQVAPPRTWQEMVDAAELIVSEEAKLQVELYGFSGQFKQYEGLVCNMMEYILSNGGEILTSERGKSGLAGRRAVEAVQFVREKIIGKAAPVGVLTYQEPESLDLFIQGKSIFHRNWPYAWEVANNRERSKVAGQVGISRLPHFRGQRSYSTLGGWQVGISNYSKNKKAAWTFVEFLTSEKIQKILALRAGRAPARKGLYADAEILESYPHFSDMKDVFITAYPRPRTPLYPAVSNILQRYFSKAISAPDIHLAQEARNTAEEIEKIIALEKRGMEEAK